MRNIDSAKLVDRIIILAHGEIVETGTCEQLMALGGNMMICTRLRRNERDELKQAKNLEEEYGRTVI